MNPLVNPAAGVDRAFYYIIGFSLVLLFGITAMMIAFVLRYRRSRNPKPADIRGHTGLEIAWMTIPTIIALSMFYVGWDAYLGLRNVPEGALEVKVEAEMFAWSFTYPNGKETANELVVPQGRPVKLLITSRDVIHSLFIPVFRVKVDAVKGLNTYAWFLPERPGTFNIFCAEYCGTGHAEMGADLRVVSPAEYEDWLQRKEEDKGAAGKEAVSEEVLKLFDLSKFHVLDDKIKFYWRVDGPQLHVKLKAPALGWVAVGLNPARAMQSADFVLAYVKNGKVFASDHFGTGPVKHEADEKLGGKSDITNLFGTEKDGVTEIGFTIPLQSGDAKDKALDPDGETVVLLAYNSGIDNFSSKHNYRSAFTVKLSTGECKPLSRKPGR